MTDKERLEHSKLYPLGFSLEVKKSQTNREVPRVEKSYKKIPSRRREGLLPLETREQPEEERRNRARRPDALQPSGRIRRDQTYFVFLVLLSYGFLWFFFLRHE